MQSPSYSYSGNWFCKNCVFSTEVYKHFIHICGPYFWYAILNLLIWIFFLLIMSFLDRRRFQGIIPVNDLGKCGRVFCIKLFLVSLSFCSALYFKGVIMLSQFLKINWSGTFPRFFSLTTDGQKHLVCIVLSLRMLSMYTVGTALGKMTTRGVM
jgi:hypothetical protein